MVSSSIQVDSDSRLLGGDELSLGEKRRGFQACAVRHGCRQTALHGSEHRVEPFPTWALSIRSYIS